MLCLSKPFIGIKKTFQGPSCAKRTHCWLSLLWLVTLHNLLRPLCCSSALSASVSTTNYASVHIGAIVTAVVRVACMRSSVPRTNFHPAALSSRQRSAASLNMSGCILNLPEGSCQVCCARAPGMPQLLHCSQCCRAQGYDAGRNQRIFVRHWHLVLRLLAQ
jgi:hypothetical protein